MKTNFVNFLSLSLLIFIWVYPAIHFSKLPEIIPTHFDGSGKADGFGSKSLIFLECGIATALFVFLMFLQRNPKLINLPDYMKKNTESLKMFLQIFTVIVMSIFAFISYQNVQAPLQKKDELSFPAGLLIGLLYLGIIGLLIFLGNGRKEKTAIETKDN